MIAGENTKAVLMSLRRTAVTTLASHRFVVQMLTSRKPFIPMLIFQKRNFANGLILIFVMGLMFVPMSLLVFATLSPQPRTDGANLGDLTRNRGSVIGFANSTQEIHALLAPRDSRFDRALGVNGPSMMMNPRIPFGLANLNSLIEYRTQGQAYSNDVLLMFLVSLPVFAIIRLMKRPSFAAGAAPKMEVVE